MGLGGEKGLKSDFYPLPLPHLTIKIKQKLNKIKLENNTAPFGVRLKMHLLKGV